MSISAETTFLRSPSWPGAAATSPKSQKTAWWVLAPPLASARPAAFTLGSTLLPAAASGGTGDPSQAEDFKCIPRGALRWPLPPAGWVFWGMSPK